MTGDCLIWGNLLHLSFNMWEDWQAPGREWRCFDPVLRFDDALWNDVMRRMSKVGMNMVVLDLGDGVRYASHPEIAVENAWEAAKLRDELAKLRDLGLEPIPKLNFATTHDAWLGPYSRCVSTPGYYEVCCDLIAEVIELFDGPRLFHLGMDEETAEHQRDYQYMVVRQFDLYWHDLRYLVERVEADGARAWIWSDCIWQHEEAFVDHLPTSVLQSNWYYGTDFGAGGSISRAAEAYSVLDQRGYEQVPTGSNISNPRNFGLTVRHCRDQLDRSRLLGFLQTPWRPTVEPFRTDHLAAVDLVAEAMSEFAESGLDG